VQVRINAKVGLALMITSSLIWVVIVLVPALPVTVAEKAVVITGLIVISEVLFWLGILVAGKELAHRYRHQLNPIEWWRKLTRKR
jgi:hypothetical protein